MSNPLEAIRAFDAAFEARAKELMREHSGNKRKVIAQLFEEFNEVIGTDVLDDLMKS